jgi:hypothetical protein
VRGTLGTRLLDVLVIEIENGDIRAVGGQLQRNRASYAAAGAGHHNSFLA